MNQIPEYGVMLPRIDMMAGLRLGTLLILACYGDRFQCKINIELIGRRDASPGKEGLSYDGTCVG